MVVVRDVQIEAELRGEIGEEQEERRGIRAAGHGDDERPGREEVVRTHEREDGGADRSGGGQRWLGRDLNPGPEAYESSALPLSYPAGVLNCMGAVRSVRRPGALHAHCIDPRQCVDCVAHRIQIHTQQAGAAYAQLHDALHVDRRHALEPARD